MVEDVNHGAAAATSQVVQGGASALEAFELQVSHDPTSIVADMVNQVRGIEMRLHGGQVAPVIGVAILEHARAASVAIVERATAPFRLCVIGEFKRGKSTLVNALLGQVVAPVDPLPETITVNCFGYGPAFSAQMRLKGGGSIALRREHLSRSALAPIIAAAPSEPLAIDVRLPIPQLQEFVLIDMPGTGDFSVDAERLVREQVVAADILAVVFNANAPVSEAERTLLRHVVQPRDFPKIMFVANMIDQVEASDIARIRDYMAAELGALFPGMRLYPLSSRNEIRRATRHADADHAAGLDPMFDAFRTDLDAIVADQRDAIRADRVGVACGEVLADMEIRLRLLAHSVAKRSDELQQDIERDRTAESRFEQAFSDRRQAVSTAVGTLALEAEAWMGAFGSRLTSSFPTQLGGLSRSHIERDMQFFLTACVESAIAACIEAHAGAFEAIGRDLLGETVELDNVGVDTAARMVSAAVFSGAQWNVGQTIRFTLDHVLGLGFAVDLVSGVVSTVAPGSDSGQYVAALALEAPKLAESIAKATRATYEAIAGNLASRLEQEYGHRRQALGDATRQAWVLQRERSGELTADRAAIEQALEWIRDADQAVLALRSRVALTDDR